MKLSFEMSADARLLRQRLALVKIGEVISYDDLGKEISKHVSGAFPALHTARRSLLNNDGYVFAVIRGEGLKRLSDEEIVSASDQDVNRIRRTAKRGARKLASVADYSSLSNAAQLRHTTRLSVMTAVAHMASSKGIEKLEEPAKGRAKELPISETLAAFAK
ncbi:MAG: hypothetical protein ACK4MV_16290 [Beijerinckiaceae bacterium]